MSNPENMSEADLAEVGRATLAKASVQKSKDKFYAAKAKHELDSLRAFAKEQEHEIPEFEQTWEDFQ